MNILFTVNSYTPHRDGVQFVTAYLAEGLAARGHGVELMTYKRKDAPAEEVINGVRVIRWDARTEHMRHLGDKKGYQQYILDNQNRFDAVINVGTQSALTDWMLPIIGKMTTPAVLYIHSIWDFRINRTDTAAARALIAKMMGNVRWRYYFLRYKKAFKSYRAVVQLHEKDYSVRNFKDWYGIDSVIIENAVDDRFFEPGLKQPYIINVSNYSPMKNQRRLIRLFAESDLPTEWRLILVGSQENDYCRSLKAYARELFPNDEGRISVLTNISREETVRLVRESGIFASTSLREAYPISTIEAMAAGVPYVSYDVGIVKWLPGGFVADADPDYIAALRELTEDRRKAEALGKEGYAFACEHCRIEKKVDELESLLRRLSGD